MNTGIQILIERMKTNPEEWCQMGNNSKMGKWESLVVLFWDYLPEEDQAAYKAARHALLADEFTEQVMKKLAGADDDGVALTSASHNDVNPLLNSYQQLRGMAQGGLRVSTQNDDINQFYSSPSIEKAKAEGNLLSNFAKSLGFK
jgi:hypothetical protein